MVSSVGANCSRKCWRGQVRLPDPVWLGKRAEAGAENTSTRNTDTKDHTVQHMFREQQRQTGFLSGFNPDTK